MTYLVKLNNDKFLLNIYLRNEYNEEKNLNKKEIEEVINYTYGDYLKISGKISIPKLLGNIGEFNYKRYLNSKDICGIINVSKVEYVDNIGNVFLKSIYNFKEWVSKSISNKLKSRESELLKSMLYGDTKNLDDGIKETFQNIGISHITAVSGSNLSILLLILSVSLYKFKNTNIYFYVELIIIIFFSVISSLELSIIRASIMTIIGLVASKRGIELNIFKNLLLTLYIMTLINPYRIFNVGMIFSFLAILGLALFSGKIYNFFESKIKWNIKNKILIKILCYLSQVLSITLAVNIFVLPLSLYLFNKLSLIFVLSNLLISTFASLICILGILSILIYKIPLISSIVFLILNISLNCIIKLSNWLENINISFDVKSFPVIILILYYLYIVAICANYQASKKYMKDKINKVKRAIGLGLCISIFTAYMQNSFFNNYIYFFNVGQGEMAIVKEGNTIIMIDSGSITNDVSYIFESYVDKENIDSIDALIISHFHSDHINGLQEIAKKCNIGYIIYAIPYDVNSETYKNCLNNIKEQNITQIIVKAGDEIKINNIKINVLFPQEEYLEVGKNDDEKENANSLVFNLFINNKNFLFMGDSIKQSEKYIIEQLKKMNISKIELLKAGHHGSETSTSEEFIQYTLPKYCIISSKKSVYNHPSTETIKLLKKYSINTYITENIGGIKYSI